MMTKVILVIFIFIHGVSMAAKNDKNKEELVIKSFHKLYEPSAVVTLPNGNVMIFEDEGGDVVTVHRISEEKGELFLEKVDSSVPTLPVDDIEGAVLGANEAVLAITSHSRNKKGKRKSVREKLVSINLKSSDTSTISTEDLVEQINQHLVPIDRQLKDDLKKLDIEAISFTGNGENLLIGLRDPVYQGKAIVVELINLVEVLTQESWPKLSHQPILLDLGGAGVRAMTYDKKREIQYIVSEVEHGKKAKMQARLWAWDKEKESVDRMTFKGIKKLNNIEGVTIVEYANQEYLLVVCDNGDKSKKRDANYAFIKLGQVTRHQ